MYTQEKRTLDPPALAVGVQLDDTWSGEEEETGSLTQGFQPLLRGWMLLSPPVTWTALTTSCPIQRGGEASETGKEDRGFGTTVASNPQVTETIISCYEWSILICQPLHQALCVDCLTYLPCTCPFPLTITQAPRPYKA